jgi:Lon protease-like protein
VWLAGLLAVPAAARAQTGAPETPGARNLPPSIPIFPLPDIALFPKVARPLHIFEPRYRAMVADALKGDRIIGMVALRPGYEGDYEGQPPIYAIGCAGLITDVEELPDGRFNIMLRGLGKFRVVSEDRSRPYRLADVEAIPEPLGDNDRAPLRAARRQLETLLASISPGSGPPPPEMPDDEVVNTLALHLDLDSADRQQLLELDGALLRARALIDLLGGVSRQAPLIALAARGR